MLMRPPYGDHAASPVSSYSTTSTLGAPSGAGGSRNGVQSATESRTSRLTTPLNFFAIPTPRVLDTRPGSTDYVVRTSPGTGEFPIATGGLARTVPDTSTSRARLLPTLYGYQRGWMGRGR